MIEYKKDRSGGCGFRPCPESCLNCPYDDCHNSKPPMRGEDGIEHYLPPKKHKERRKMITKYSIGDTVLVEATINGIVVDEDGEFYTITSEYWKGEGAAQEKDLSPKASKKTAKASEKPKKASPKPQKSTKTATNRKKTAKAEEKPEKKTKEKAAGKASKGQQDTAKKTETKSRQQDNEKRVKLSPAGKTLAKELARAAG